MVASRSESWATVKAGVVSQPLCTRTRRDSISLEVVDNFRAASTTGLRIRVALDQSAIKYARTSFGSLLPVRLSIDP